MNCNLRRFAGLSLSFSLLFASVLGSNILRSVEAQQNAPQPTTLKVSNKNIGGAIELTFDTLLYGDVKVFLPDDTAAGDTISGTVVTEPKGSTPEERAKNKDHLEDLVVELGDQKVSAGKPGFTWVAPPRSPTPNRYMIRLVDVIPNKELASTTIPFITTTLDSARPQTITPTDFRLPKLGQQGRAVEVSGPFDGNSSNTTLTFPGSGTGEPVADQFGLIAESPRKAVFRAPTNVTGPIEMNLKEGNVETKGTFRVVDVALSAGKTNLQKGERTSLTVEVSGLEGIKDPVPLQLDARGVIIMDGGNFQNIPIMPSAIQTGGRFVTTRAITGQQAGGFTVIATVIVRPYDVSLTDDSNAGRRILWNTFTGDYLFANPPGIPRPGEPGQGPPPTVTGTGKPVMKGCIITLSHNAPDRRVFARLDVCTNTGNAEVQTKSPKTNSKITDTNTTDNSSASSP